MFRYRLCNETLHTGDVTRWVASTEVHKATLGSFCTVRELGSWQGQVLWQHFVSMPVPGNFSAPSSHGMSPSPVRLRGLIREGKDSPLPCISGWFSQCRYLQKCLEEKYFLCSWCYHPQQPLGLGICTHVGSELLPSTGAGPGTGKAPLASFPPAAITSCTVTGNNASDKDTAHFSESCSHLLNGEIPLAPESPMYAIKSKQPPPRTTQCLQHQK